MDTYKKTLKKDMEKLTVEELKVGYLAWHRQKKKASKASFEYRQTDRGRASMIRSNSKRDNNIYSCTCGREVKVYNKKNHEKTNYHIKYNNNPKIPLLKYSFIDD